MAALTGERPVALFQGYDSVTDNGKQSAVTGASKPMGAENTSYCSICKTATELAKSLQIDASLSASYAGFGSADAKMNFFHSLNVTASSLSIVVYARKVSGSTTRTDAHLKDGIAIPADDDKLADFVSTYGDSFVSSITLGGEYYAVYTFYSETEEEQTKLEAELKANGIVAGVSLSAEVSTKISNYSKTSTTRSVFKQHITGIESPPQVNAEEIATFASKFSGLKLDSPVVIAITTTGYEELEGFRRRFAPIVKARRYFAREDGIAKKLAKLKQIDNQATLIKHIYEFYGGHRDEALDRNQAAVREDLKVVRRQLDDYSDDPTQSFTEPPLSSLAKGSPTLKFEHGITLYGGNSGEPFDDVDVAGYLRRRTRIVKLRIKTGDWIDHLETTYANESQTWQTSHGGSAGEYWSELTLLAGEFFVKGAGRWANERANVNHIILVTNQEHTVSGGKSGEIPFDMPLKPDRFLLGFFGFVRDGSCRSIGIHHARLLDAQWRPID